jgi:hypothetical protein
MRSPLAMQLSPRFWGENEKRTLAAMPNSKGRMHRAPAPKGEHNGNFRHGRLTNEAIDRRRAVKSLIRQMRRTARRSLARNVQRHRIIGHNHAPMQTELTRSSPFWGEFADE